jgi:hypothetical protein
MVYDSERNITLLQSYGWRQCRLAPGGSVYQENSDEDMDAQTRMIQVGF